MLKIICLSLFFLISYLHPGLFNKIKYSWTWLVVYSLLPQAVKVSPEAAFATGAVLLWCHWLMRPTWGGEMESCLAICEALHRVRGRWGGSSRKEQLPSKPSLHVYRLENTHYISRSYLHMWRKSWLKRSDGIWLTGSGLMFQTLPSKSIKAGLHIWNCAGLKSAEEKWHGPTYYKDSSLGPQKSH